MKRRESIRWGGLFILSGLAGCGGLSGPDREEVKNKYNLAKDTYDRARRAKNTAHGNWNDENYAAAKTVYSNAKDLFRDANSELMEASEGLHEIDCTDMARMAEARARAAIAWADTCRDWARAAEAMEEGNRDTAEVYLEDATDNKNRAEERLEGGPDAASC